MTNKELQERLKKYPDNIEIVFSQCGYRLDQFEPLEIEDVVDDFLDLKLDNLPKNVIVLTQYIWDDDCRKEYDL